jgi:hypothetical protein
MSEFDEIRNRIERETEKNIPATAARDGANGRQVGLASWTTRDAPATAASITLRANGATMPSVLHAVTTGPLKIAR